MTYNEAKINIRGELSDLYEKNEITSFIKIMFSDLFNVSSIQLISRENDHLTSEQSKTISDVIKRLKLFEPLQYIIGRTEFYGLKFRLNKHVLIPRPETEELVDMIIKDHKQIKALNIIDVGTGSGCIAVCLAKHLNKSKVSAFDISRKALNITERNSLDNNVKLTLIQGDILNYSGILSSDKFDIIVSNPPYVTNSEKKLMEQNVLNYEPGLALFVEDESPLIFYNEISEFAKKHLKKGGKLYFEINEIFGNKISELLISKGFKETAVYKDMNGKDRMLKCSN